MKIGILCYPTYGGSGIVATELGMSLAEKGHEVHFISANLPARLDMTKSNIHFHKVNLEAYPLFEFQPFDIALSSSIYQVVKRYGLELIHAHYAVPYAYAAYFTKQMLLDEGIKLPVITTLHGTDITLVGQHPSYKQAVEFSINHSDAVTSVSESLKQATHQAFNIKKDIKVIYNFIDNELYSQECPCCRDNFAQPDEKILLHVSNFRKVKRIQDVLAVFKQVNALKPCKLVLVGEGPEMEVVHDFLDQNPQLISRIKLMGKLNDLFQILKMADIFLLPSEQESFGLAALEAMAAYTAVVSSNAGGIPEVNLHGKTGFVSPVGDVDSMAQQVLTLMNDDLLLSQMKHEAFAVAQQFDLNNILPQYEALYREVVDNI